MKKNCYNNKTKKKNFWHAFALIWKYYKSFVWELCLIFILSIISSAISIGCVIGMQYSYEYKLTDFSRISMICGIIIGIYLIDWIILFFQYRLCVIIGEKLAMRLRNDLFHKLNTLSIFYYDTNKTGDIMSKFTNDINNISMLISNNMADIIGCTIWVVGLTVGMLLISPTLTLIVFFFFVLMILAITFFIKRSTQHFVVNQKTLGNMSSFLQEKILGQPIIDIYNQQENIFQEFKKINKQLTTSTYKSQFYGGGSIPFLLGLINIASVTITVVAMIIILSGNINAFAGINVAINMPGQPDGFMTLTVFMILSRQFYSPLMQVSNIMNIVMGAKAASERLEPIFNEKSEFNDFEKIIVSICYSVNINKLNKEVTYLEPKIEFKDVNFGYDDNNLMLKNINLKIKKGDFIGIVGPTGSGKTTLVNLISKFYPINSGDITIDGISIKDMDKNSLRKNISMVLQDNFLFEISIKDNLKIVNPEATDEQIEHVAKLTECYDIIMNLPNGFDTIVSNESDMLSKGEKQLIAIARALLANNDLLILDEATSSVDTKTEKRIQNAMMKLIKNKTSIMIAHRLSTIRDATKIVVIKDGIILEVGNHEELLKLNGFYAQLYNSQLNVIE